MIPINALISGTIIGGNCTQNDIFIEGGTGSTGCTGTACHSEYVLKRGDGIGIIYANTIEGPVNIILGTPTDATFEANRQIFIKDVSLEYAAASSYNINVTVPHVIDGPEVIQPRIEFYCNGALTVGTGSYVINSSGGAVTLRYFQSGLLGSAPTWVIENQFIGNSRILPSTGYTFIPATSKIRSHMINRKS